MPFPLAPTPGQLLEEIYRAGYKPTAEDHEIRAAVRERGWGEALAERVVQSHRVHRYEHQTGNPF